MCLLVCMHACMYVYIQIHVCVSTYIYTHLCIQSTYMSHLALCAPVSVQFLSDACTCPPTFIHACQVLYTALRGEGAT